MYQYSFDTVKLNNNLSLCLIFRVVGGVSSILKFAAFMFLFQPPLSVCNYVYWRFLSPTIMIFTARHNARIASAGNKLPTFVVFWTTSTIKDEKPAAKFHYYRASYASAVSGVLILSVRLSRVLCD